MRTQPDLDGGFFSVPDTPAIPAVDLEVRQSELMSRILTLRFRKTMRYASRADLAELKLLSDEFASNNVKLKRRKRK